MAFAHHAILPVAQRQWRVCRQIPQLNLLPEAFVIHLEQHLPHHYREGTLCSAKVHALEYPDRFGQHTAPLTRTVHFGEDTASTTATLWVSCTKLEGGRLSGELNKQTEHHSSSSRGKLLGGKRKVSQAGAFPNIDIGMYCTRLEYT